MSIGDRAVILSLDAGGAETPSNDLMEHALSKEHIE